MHAIPFVNLHRQYENIGREINEAVADVIKRQNFINGPVVREFSAVFNAAIGAAHGFGCSNGTAAISLALEALGVGRGDEVITVAHSFFATVEAIYHVGAKPVFVDIDPQTYTIDLSKIEVTPRTKAIIPVHIYGNPADMDPLMALAAKQGLYVVEDAAQAHLASYRGRCAGTIGDAGTFSFYPGKNLGAYGDAGFVTARNPDVARLLSSLIDHGRQSKYTHDIIGYNQRMDEIQAAVLKVKLSYLKSWTDRRRQLAERYDSALRRDGFKTIVSFEGANPVYHLYVVEVANRDNVLESLRAAGIGCGVHYPVPLHQQPALLNGDGKGVSLPVTERVAGRILSLPICGDLTDAEQDRVIEAFLKTARP